MDIVIVGDGKVGETLSMRLSQEHHDVTVIDSSASALLDTINAQDVNCIQGNGVSHAVQREAGVNKADLMIAATSADEINMLCCMVAKKLGAKHTIARVRNPEYQEQMVFLRDELGLSMVVNPEQSAAMEISRLLRFPTAIKVDPFAKGRIEMVEFKVREDSPLHDQPLHALYSRYRIKILIVAAQRGEDVTIPRGDYIIRSGDKLTVLGAPNSISAFLRAIDTAPRRVKEVMIAGAGRIGYYLAKTLIDSGMRVKIIERSEKRCNELYELLPKATIINGDATDHELLHEEGLDNTDAMIALTGMDEENIILAMYANSRKGCKVVAKVNNSRLVDMMESSSSGVESFIAPKDIAADRIISYVRAMTNATGSNVETMYSIADDKVEALEFRVKSASRCIGIPLKNMRISKDVLIGGIMRHGVCVIPGGDDVINAGDSVIIVTAREGLNELDGILEEE